MTGGENRYYSRSKALRKRRIVTRVYGGRSLGDAYYNNLHQYSKNKIHCSCSLCSMKTRNKGNRRNHAGGYKGVYNYSRSDRQQLDAMDYGQWELAVGG